MEKKTFTPEQRQRFQDMKSVIDWNLRNSRAVSEAIWTVGAILCLADSEGLWPMDMAEILKQPAPGRTRRPKDWKPSRELWASVVFKISVRQAHKYFLVGERLDRDYIEGPGICLDRMEQVALAAPEFRDAVMDLAEAGMSLSTLRQAREAGEEELKRDPRIANPHFAAQFRGDSHARREELAGGPKYSERSIAVAAKQPGLALMLMLVRQASHEADDQDVAAVRLEEAEELQGLVEQLKDRVEQILADAHAAADAQASRSSI